MAQTEKPPPARAASTDRKTSIWKRLFGKDESSNAPLAPPLPAQEEQQQQQQHPGIGRRLSRKVVPGLPRPGTFKRQQSELRDRLEPAKPNPDERRTLSVDRRRNASARDSSTVLANPSRLSAPQLFDNTYKIDAVLDPSNQLSRTTTHESEVQEYVDVMKDPSTVDTTYAQSVSTEAFDEMILEELEKKWILNLSMHFRDKARREKFFVTYAETPTHWRRVTISLDYRNATKGSLEEELLRTQFQRDKSARIYEAIRESLPDIQFYDTVTNLKLQTENDRLHVHVVEDLSEIIHYPSVKAINHLKCRRVREEELVFDSHLSGFVYKVRVDGHVFIKKEIPGPDTVDEFLYEINALHQLSGSHSVIQFGGVVLDNKGEYVKGLLISFAEKGALIDVIYDGEGSISWSRRERWAKQIVQGLSEIHEAGFVQGDFTLSNIVIDAHDNAKIIDINRRGCPVGWEPPEVAALIENSQRISMYIGVKSDLYQLGMVLYALATQEDEPENHRPLNLACFPTEIPEYFLDVCYHCLDEDPRHRSQASALLARFPDVEEYFYVEEAFRPIVVEARSPGGPPYSNGMHTDRLSYGHNDDFDDYGRSEYSDGEGDYPRRGRSTRRSRTPSPPRAFRAINPAEFPLPPSSVGSHLMGHSQVIPVPDHTEYENEITILDEKAAAASDDLPTPTADVRLEEDVTTPTLNDAVEETFATSMPIDKSTPYQSEEEIPNLPLIIVRDQDLLSLHGIVKPEETMPTPTSLNGPEVNIPLPISVPSSQGISTPISIIRPEESIPLPSSVCSNEYMPTPNSILEHEEHIPLPASFVHSNEDIPTPTSIYGPKEDFCQIIQEARTPSSEITRTTQMEPPQHQQQLQQVLPRKTEAAPPTPPQTVIVDYLTGIGGAHSTVPLDIPSASLDDFLTTDMHNDPSII